MTASSMQRQLSACAPPEHQTRCSIALINGRQPPAGDELLRRRHAWQIQATQNGACKMLNPIPHLQIRSATHLQPDLTSSDSDKTHQNLEIAADDGDPASCLQHRRWSRAQ
ncbi:hypothetical protein ACLOJK_017827 [Asimina triloba]